MAQIITATAEETEGRVKLVATGGTVGDAFYVVRQDSQGSNLIRETTGDGVTWQADPAATKKNLFKNPDTNYQTIALVETRRNYATNPRFRLPSANIAAGWSAYSSGTVTGTRVNDGTNGQFINTTSIAAAAKYGIVSGARTFTATTRRVVVSLGFINGTVDDVVAANTIPAKVQVEFKLGATVVNSQTVTLPDWNSIQTIAYTGGASVDSVVTTIYLENTTGSTVTAPQKLRPVSELIEITSLNSPIFHGSTPSEEDGELTYAWTGTTDASASIQRRPGVNLCPSYVASIVYSSIAHGTREMAIRSNGISSSPSYTTLDGTAGGIRIGMVAGKTYTIMCKMRLDYALTGTQFSNGRRIAAITKVGANPSVTTYSNQAPNAAGTYDLSVTFDVPVGASDAYVLVYNGSSNEGDTVWVDKILVVEGTYTGDWFDGDSENASWDGAVDNSTSTLISAALPITMYDYEARQGFTTTYTITNELGVPDASYVVNIPQWGTWLKDPFRPYLNTRVLWHADSEYIRSARREKLWARGAKFPVFHSDKRSAPNGQVTVGVETTAEAKALTSLLDIADTIMIDVDSKFGVPVRYVSVGDIAGSRVGSDSAGLSWEARYFTLQVDEVAMPIGAPVNQNLTYDQLAANFGSYIAIPASVATYDDLAAGNWG